MGVRRAGQLVAFGMCAAVLMTGCSSTPDSESTQSTGPDTCEEVRSLLTSFSVRAVDYGPQQELGERPDSAVPGEAPQDYGIGVTGRFVDSNDQTAFEELLVLAARLWPNETDDDTKEILKDLAQGRGNSDQLLASLAGACQLRWVPVNYFGPTNNGYTVMD